MSGRRLLGYILIFAIGFGVVTAGLVLAPALLSRLPASANLPATLGIGAVLAVALLFLFLITDQLLLQDDTQKPLHDPMKAAQDFSQRTLGVVSESALAAATSAMLADWLDVMRSGWLLLAPQGANFFVSPVSNKGQLHVEPTEFSFNNPLLLKLSQSRQPLLRGEVEADPKYKQMLPAERDWVKKLGAEAYAPIFDAGILAAILVVGPKAHSGPLKRADLELIALITAQAASTLKATRVINELEEMNTSMTALNETLREKNDTVTKMDSSRGDFLAIASHELRTPITQLLGFADLLGSMADDNSLDAETVKDVTASIVRACERLNEVINQILDMAQLDVNALDLKFKDTSIEVILRHAIEPYVQAMRDRRLGLRITGLKGLPSMQADEQRLVQAFGQLMSNAIKYTPDGGKIEISARPLPPEDNLPTPQIEVVFADSGIGIDPQYHVLIFDKFYRIGSASQHSTSTTKFMGAGPGLGLPIAKGVVERHGGKIWVESAGCDMEKLPGSRFHVILPIKPPAFDPRALEIKGNATTTAKETRNVPRQNPFVNL
jgi:signal transduction histidine kinase